VSEAWGAEISLEHLQDLEAELTKLGVPQADVATLAAKLQGNGNLTFAGEMKALNGFAAMNVNMLNAVNMLIGIQASNNPPLLDPNTIPGQNHNTWANPSSPTPDLYGSTKVDTGSLTSFSQWLTGDLTESLKALEPKLRTVQAEPGDFADADALRTKINFSGGSSSSQAPGVADQFITVIADLVNGLADMAGGLDKLVALYANTEDLNNAQASQLESDMTNSFASTETAFNVLGGALSDSSGSSGSGTS
jgi:hypothetical protein